MKEAVSNACTSLQTMRTPVFLHLCTQSRPSDPHGTTLTRSLRVRHTYDEQVVARLRCLGTAIYVFYFAFCSPRNYVGRSSPTGKLYRNYKVLPGLRSLPVVSVCYLPKWDEVVRTRFGSVADAEDVEQHPGRGMHARHSQVGSQGQPPRSAVWQSRQQVDGDERERDGG